MREREREIAEKFLREREREIDVTLFEERTMNTEIWNCQRPWSKVITALSEIWSKRFISLLFWFLNNSSPTLFLVFSLSLSLCLYIFDYMFDIYIFDFVPSVMITTIVSSSFSHTAARFMIFSFGVKYYGLGTMVARNDLPVCHYIHIRETEEKEKRMREKEEGMRQGSRRGVDICWLWKMCEMMVSSLTFEDDEGRKKMRGHFQKNT